MVIGHVLPEKNESLLEAYEKYRLIADAKTCCDYALHVGVTWWGPKVLRHCLLCHKIVSSIHDFESWLFIRPPTKCVRLCPPGAGRDGETGEGGRSKFLSDVHGL